MPPSILRIDETKEVETLLARAAQVVLFGGVVAVPTESFYGLAVNALDEQAVRRLLQVKKIRDRHPILTLISSREVLERTVLRIPPLAEDLMQAFWPGGLTLVLEASDDVPPLLTAGTGKIGVRLSGHPLATGLALAVGNPITGTSANVTGGAPCVTAEEVLSSLGDGVDLIVDGGRTEGGVGSTVLDVTIHPPRILREGIIGRVQLRPFIPGL
ncbi:MAG: threonylcarbamoyl-AMP synthase [Deltaproteobacteria bacterium]|nr:threonylcarbamoyl-AMP synthase [Deltaproteobacteria bacterium]